MTCEGFQISRHWRLNEKRYRLVGEMRGNGEVSLTGHFVPKTQPEQNTQQVVTPQIQDTLQRIAAD